MERLRDIRLVTRNLTRVAAADDTLDDLGAVRRPGARLESFRDRVDSEMAGVYKYKNFANKVFCVC